MDLLEIYDADTPTLHRMLAEIDAFLSSAHPAPAIADATRRRDVVRLELDERRASDAIYHQMALPSAAPAAPPPAFASPSPRLASPPPPLPSSPSPSAPAAAPSAAAPLPSLAERLRAAQREEAEAKARERAARAARAAAAGRQAAEAKAAAAEKAAEAQRLAAERLVAHKRKAAEEREREREREREKERAKEKEREKEREREREKGARGRGAGRRLEGEAKGGEACVEEGRKEEKLEGSGEEGSGGGGRETQNEEEGRKDEGVDAIGAGGGQTREEEGAVNSVVEPEAADGEEARQEEHRRDVEGGVESGEAAGLREEEGAADIPAASDAPERSGGVSEAAPKEEEAPRGGEGEGGGGEAESEEEGEDDGGGDRAVAMAEGRAEASCSGRRASSWRSGAAEEEEGSGGEGREEARGEEKAEEKRVEEEQVEEQRVEEKRVQEERAVEEKDEEKEEEREEEERQGGAEAQCLPAATEADSLRLDRSCLQEYAALFDEDEDEEEEERGGKEEKGVLEEEEEKKVREEERKVKGAGRREATERTRGVESCAGEDELEAQMRQLRARAGKPEGGKGEGGRGREAARKGKGAGRGVVRAAPPLMDFGSLDEEEEEEDEDEDEDEAEAGGIAEWSGSAEPLDVVQAVQRLQLAFPDASEELLRAAISQHRSFTMAMSFLFQQHLFPPASRAVAYGRRQVKPPPAAAIAAASDGGNRAAYSKFEDIFLTPPPSVELLRKHLECVELFYAELRAPQPEWEYRFFRVAQAKTEIYQILRDLALASRDAAGGGVRWLELPPSLYGRSCATWNLLWTWRPPRVQWAELLPWQRVNHFPNARNLTRKDMLKKHLQRARQLRGDAFDIMPLTYALPAEYLLFVDAYSRCADESDGSAGSNRWIMKPVGLSRGRGISIIDDISAVSYGEAYVIQRYVHRPLLLDGFKFDLRLYVCVNSFTPLEAYIYKEGFGRFSTERYSNDPASLSNKFVHLTNSSIQKEQTSLELLAKSSNFDNAVGGTKCALSLLLQRLRAAGIDTAALWGRIVEVVLRSLFAVQDAIPSYPSCFELFGYDLLIDTEMKPWLLEVNASPSLARENPLDSKVKDALLADTLRLVAPPHFDRAIWAEMVRSRLPDRPADRSRLSSAPPFAAELAALLHGQTAFFSGRPPPSEEHARACSYERIAPSAAWERVVGRRGERGVARAQSGGGGGPPLHVRGSLDRFL